MSKKSHMRGARPDHSAHSARRVPYLFRLSLLGMAIMLLSGTFALLFNGGSLAPPAARAAQVGYDDLSVVGLPTLPATTVNAIFARLGSPMSGTGAVVEQVSAQMHIDDAFALAVWWTETNDGAAGVGLADRNPGSVRGSSGYPSAYDGYTIYPNYTDAIVYWFHMLRNLYVDRGLATVYAISHPYVGTSNSPLWAGKVITLMLRYRGEVPPPTPVPTLAPSPTFSPDLPHHRPAGLFGGALRTGTPPPTAQSGWSQLPIFSDAAQGPITGQSSIGTWSIVLFALLLALAIALWPVRFTGSHRADAQRADGHKGAVPHIHPVRPLRLPSLPATTHASADPAGLFARLPETPGVGKIRRVMLLPARQDDETRAGEEAIVAIEETAHIRSTGLLARYGQREQE